MKKRHLVFAVRAFQWVISERKEKHSAPPVKTAEKGMLQRMDSPAVRGGATSPVPGIKAIVAGHLEIPFGDMLDEERDESHDRVVCCSGK